MGDWKLIQGSPGDWNGWYPAPGDGREVERGHEADALAPEDYLLFNVKGKKHIYYIIYWPLRRAHWNSKG